MPTYTYKCRVCADLHDVFVKVSEATPTRDCAKCGAAASSEKQVSAGSFHLKGTGWYATDFRGPSGK